STTSTRPLMRTLQRPALAPRLLVDCRSDLRASPPGARRYPQHLSCRTFRRGTAADCPEDGGSAALRTGTASSRGTASSVALLMSSRPGRHQSGEHDLRSRSIAQLWNPAWIK